MQNYFVDPEFLVTALGAARVKTDEHYDKDFTLASWNVSFGVKYKDASNPQKGGKAYG